MKKENREVKQGSIEKFKQAIKKIKDKKLSQGASKALHKKYIQEIQEIEITGRES